MTAPRPPQTVPLSVAEREATLLAPYAMHSADSAGRRYSEPPHAYRGPWQRDRDRIVHCSASRRLSRKTQVFTGEMGDYHRTRLTHTLEVASIARTLGRALRLNEDLIEALALAHDLGHPPFGHAGEDALDACLRDDGGFCHNRQALVIVEELEQRYPEFPGLNLTFEVLAGQRARVEKPATAPLEVQVVDAADSIAYDTHDADDALELGLLAIDELLEIPLWREAAARVKRRWTALKGKQLERAVVHELIDWLAGDLLEHSLARLGEHGFPNAATAAAAPAVIRPGDELAQMKSELESYLHARVYRHPDVLETRSHATQCLVEMFEHFVGAPQRLPEFYQKRAEQVGLRRAAGDYLACMTDRTAQESHRRELAAETGDA